MTHDLSTVRDSVQYYDLQQPGGSTKGCEWTHCAYPPMPPENASLHGLVYQGAPYVYETDEVLKGDKLQYHCFNGRKNVLDFDFTFQEASCASENQWTPPAVWENCTTSTYDLSNEA